MKKSMTDTPTVVLPTPKSERFKYTNIAKAVQNIAPNPTAATMTVDAPDNMVTRVNNVADLPTWARDLLHAPPAGAAQYHDMALWDAVNNAADLDAIVIDVPSGAAACTLHVTQQAGATTTPRIFMRVATGAQATVIEHHTGGDGWHNGVTQITLAAGATLRHYRVQNGAASLVHTHNTHVAIDRDATYEAFTLTSGAGFSRNQIHADLTGANAEVRLAGVNLLSGAQTGDTTITIEHQAPHCRSNQTYKTILTDNAHGVFQGKVHVHRAGQQTDGYQLSNALLLSPTAIMDTKPELEIYADDVKCSHGATTGQLDQAPLFYLRTRGLNEAQAKMLLMQAFLGPALAEIRDETVHDTFSALANNWLEAQSQ